MKFALEIQLGNDAMQTGESIAIALRNQADYIATRYSLDQITASAPKNGKHDIRDDNGNVVGSWTVGK